MAAGPTYEPIATNTLVSATGSITFSTITGIYTDLVLISNIKSNTANNSSLLFQINGVDNGFLYSGTMIFGNGSVAQSNRQSNQDQNTLLRNGGLSTNTLMTQVFITHFNSYSNTAIFKTVMTRNAVSDVVTGVDFSLFRSTAAITSIRIFASTNDFAIGSRFTLYGIAAA